MTNIAMIDRMSSAEVAYRRVDDGRLEGRRRSCRSAAAVIFSLRNFRNDNCFESRQRHCESTSSTQRICADFLTKALLQTLTALLLLLLLLAAAAAAAAAASSSSAAAAATESRQCC
jgi:hypothetical protein